MKLSIKLKLTLLFALSISLIISFISLSKIINSQKKPTRTVKQVLDIYQSSGLKRLSNSFKRANINMPPKELRLLAFKRERKVELWARDLGEWKAIKTYQFTATSGKLGPKLKQGDEQIPEGVYSIIGLNPNSSYHLSMKLNYPNEFDKYYAKKEGRVKPGNNIFIHGKNKSVGCIALGDTAIEEIFVIVALTGKDNTKVVISPYDFRNKRFKKTWKSPKWAKSLYSNISNSLKLFTKN